MVINRSAGELHGSLECAQVELLPHISAVISVIVGTGGVTIVICIGLWLLFCRW